MRRIDNEADYDAALAEIDRLMDTAPDTAESDEFEALVTLVEAYEAKRWPIEPPDPEKFIGKSRSTADAKK